MDANREIQVSDEEAISLEMECAECEGVGVIREYEGNHVCSRRGGSGYERTELGQRILNLVRNNFAVLMREMINGEVIAVFVHTHVQASIASDSSGFSGSDAASFPQNVAVTPSS